MAGYVSSLLTQLTEDSGPVQSYLSMLRQLLTAVLGSDQCVCMCVCVREVGAGTWCGRLCVVTANTAHRGQWACTVLPLLAATVADGCLR